MFSSPAALLRPDTSASVRLLPEAAGPAIITADGEMLSLCTHPENETQYIISISTSDNLHLTHDEHYSISPDFFQITLTFDVDHWPLTMRH